MIRPPVTYQIPPIRSASGNSANSPRRSQSLRSNRSVFMPPNFMPLNGPRLSDAGRPGTIGGASRISGVSPRSGGTGLSARSAMTPFLLGIDGALVQDRLPQVLFDGCKLRDHFFNAVSLDPCKHRRH